MAWNPSPEIADLRELARKWGAQRIIVLSLPGDGTFSVHSFGETRRLCQSAKQINDAIFKLVESGQISVD